VSTDRPRAAVVLGARNLGGAITRELLGRGMRVATVSRTQADLEVLALDGARAVRADAGDPDDLTRALNQMRREIGPLDLIVNAVSAARPAEDGSGFGGGALAEATMAGFDGWTVAVARQAFVALSTGTRALHDHGGTFVQVVGAPARRANPQRGLIAAGAAAVRALSHAAAQELRHAGVHVAMVIVDGVIDSPKTARMTATMPADALVRQQDVTAAVAFLASQSPRGMTHELVLTPAGDRWVP
jgi:NAD(P)-dependent dehydrogenase (short-subunit alcohol dehydrogenase family)